MTRAQSTQPPPPPRAQRGGWRSSAAARVTPACSPCAPPTCVRSADVVITEGPEHVPLGPLRACGLPEGAEGGPELVDGGFGEDGQPLTHAARAKVVVRQAKRGVRVVRLMTGDPFVYASGPEEARPAPRPASASRSCPASPRSAAVPAYAGIPLTTKDHREVTVVTAGDEGRLEPLRRRARPWSCSRPSARSATSPRALVDGRPLGRDPGRDDPHRHHHRAARPSPRRSSTSPPTPAPPGWRRRRSPSSVTWSTMREALSWFETKPLFGWRILVPRTKEQAGSLSARLRGYGGGARGGADHLGRAAAQPAADGQGRPRPGRGPLRVDRLHQRQRGQGRPREVRGVRPRRPRVLRPQDRRRR